MQTQISDSLILEKSTIQKEHKGEQLAEKVQPDLDVYLGDDNEPAELIKIDDSSFKCRRSNVLRN